jgi:hypothetical protein
MNRAKQEEEKKRYVDKLFKYAETPIKEWLAEYLKVDTKVAFPDYADNSEDIGFKHDDKYYVAYYVTLEPGQKSKVSVDLLKNSETTRKACSQLCDAIQIVMPAVVKTAAEAYLEKIRGFYFNFDEKTMSFELLAVNAKKHEKIMAAQQLDKLFEMKSSFESKLADLDNPESAIIKSGCISDLAGLREETANHLNQLKDLFAKAETVYDGISEEEIKTEDARCEEINKSMNTNNRLHLVVEESDPEDQIVRDESMKRLPVFGAAYQDTEDETFTEKLKKYYALQD